jgi:nucleoid DNA-binding protein
MNNERDIINHLASKYKMTDAKILAIVDFQRRFILDEIRNFTPRILIHNFGSFNLSKAKLNKKINRLIASARRRPDRLESIYKELKIVWAAKQNLMKWENLKKKE